MVCFSYIVDVDAGKIPSEVSVCSTRHIDVTTATKCATSAAVRYADIPLPFASTNIVGQPVRGVVVTLWVFCNIERSTRRKLGLEYLNKRMVFFRRYVVVEAPKAGT